MTEEEAKKMEGRICVRVDGIIEIPCKIISVRGRLALAHFPIGGERKVDVAFLHEADEHQEKMYVKERNSG